MKIKDDATILRYIVPCSSAYGTWRCISGMGNLALEICRPCFILRKIEAMKRMEKEHA